MDDYKAKELRKLWAVIEAASLNGPCGSALRISTTGTEPSASTVIQAYVLRDFVRKPEETN